MTHLYLTDDQLLALRNVYAGDIRYHNGLSTPAVGYRWRESLGAGEPQHNIAEALQFLWAHDLIDVDTQVIKCQGAGHAVRVTHRGWMQLVTADTGTGSVSIPGQRTREEAVNQRLRAETHGEFNRPNRGRAA